VVRLNIVIRLREDEESRTMKRRLFDISNFARMGILVLAKCIMAAAVR
jgi:hypothetical protein